MRPKGSAEVLADRRRRALALLDEGNSLNEAKVSPSVRPDQVILYNGFEPYQHENWYGQADLEAGHVKHLGFASGYGHLKYRLFSWQPIPADRAVHVDIEKVR